VGWMFQSAEMGCFDVSKMPGSFPIRSIGGFVLHDDTQIIGSKRRHVMLGWYLNMATSITRPCTTKSSLHYFVYTAIVFRATSKL
jgi:hypothetical protein